jgi:molybdenum cofactor cytidylyltransferase
MKRHKLLLPWKSSTIIEHVLAAWKSSRVTRVVIVIRGSDRELQEACRSVGVDLVLPDFDPPDMKISIQHALTHIQDKYDPSESDAWMLAPADMPRLSSAVIDQVLDAHGTNNVATGNRKIIVPTVRGQAGHPVLFPWLMYREVFSLGPGEGVNALVKRHPTTDLVLETDDILADLDTPADYERLQATETPTVKTDGRNG